jgi:hypothetical protein
VLVPLLLANKPTHTYLYHKQARRILPNKEFNSSK